MLLGAQLRALREAAAITREAAGYEIRSSRSKISRLELGRVSCKERDITDLLTLYGVGEGRRRDAVLALATRANERGWWAPYGDVLPEWFEEYVGLEGAASLIRTYELQFVPGLFQTEDYARAVVRLGYPDASADEVDRRVGLRVMRQRHFIDSTAGAGTRGEATRLWAVVDETALRRPLGGVAVMRAQLDRLIELTARRPVTLQVMPFRHGGHAAAGGPFSILRFAEPDLPDVVYLEQLTSALYLDKRDDVDHYLAVMDRLFAEAEPPEASTAFLKKLRKEL
jgi:transcriptional regulator with XRE-family HTH domain